VNSRAFRSVKDSLGRSTDYLVVSELHKLMREGVTAVLEAVNELSATVCGLTERIAGELGARSTANAYISFGNVSGFGMHNDDHDVIILQLDGRKEWKFVRSAAYGKGTVADCPALSDDAQYESIIVSAGDVMYVPKGTWHDVVALNEQSLHLTVSVVYPTIAEFLTWCIAHEKAGIAAQDLKPDSQCIDRTLGQCQRFLGTLASRKHIDNFLGTFYADKQCSRTRTNFPSLNVPNEAARFRRVPFEIVTLRQNGPDRHDIYALGRIHSLTNEEYAVLRDLPRTGAMSGSEVAKIGGGWDATVYALETLMDLGLVTTVT
jgi:ribosomal protein L16 Arg81 hydroxylase